METKKCIKCGEHKPISEMRKNRNECKKCKYAYSRKYHYENIDKYRAQQRRAMFGDIEDWYHSQLKKQKGKCAICGFVFNFDTNRLTSPHVDHDHRTGKLRGLLCAKCNTAIGLLKDDPYLAISAAKYLMVN